MSEQSQPKFFSMTVEEIVSVIPLSFPIPVEAIKYLRGYSGLKALYEAGRRSGQTKPLPADNEQIIQLSERNAFRWPEEGCRAFR